MGFIDSDLAQDPSVRSGYTIALTPGDPAPDTPVACNGIAVVDTYFASAEPLNEGPVGMRFFATNQNGVIVHSTSPMAVTQDGTPEGATPIQP